MRAATCSEHRAGPENYAVEADPPPPWGRPLSQEKRREMHPAVPPGYLVAARMGQIQCATREVCRSARERQRQTREGPWRPRQMADGSVVL